MKEWVPIVAQGLHVIAQGDRLEWKEQSLQTDSKIWGEFAV